VDCLDAAALQGDGTIRSVDLITNHHLRIHGRNKEQNLNNYCDWKISNVMENLSLQDHPQGGGLDNVHPSGGPPQLPPQV